MVNFDFISGVAPSETADSWNIDINWKDWKWSKVLFPSSVHTLWGLDQKPPLAPPALVLPRCSKYHHKDCVCLLRTFVTYCDVWLFYITENLLFVL